MNIDRAQCVNAIARFKAQTTPRSKTSATKDSFAAPQRKMRKLDINDAEVEVVKPERDDHIAPPETFIAAACIVSNAISALFYESDSTRDASFRVNIAPGLRHVHGSDWHFDESAAANEYSFVLNISRVPRLVLDFEPQYHPALCLYLSAFAYIKYIRSSNPTFGPAGMSDEDAASEMARHALEVEIDTMRIVAKKLWN